MSAEVPGMRNVDTLTEMSMAGYPSAVRCCRICEVRVSANWSVRGRFENVHVCAARRVNTELGCICKPICCMNRSSESGSDAPGPGGVGWAAARGVPPSVTEVEERGWE